MAMLDRLAGLVSPTASYRRAVQLCGAGKAAEAFPLMAVAARAGVADAEYRVGRAYLEGVGVPPSRSEGARWLEQAASHGSVEGQALLAALYVSGLAAATGKSGPGPSSKGRQAAATTAATATGMKLRGFHSKSSSSTASSTAATGVPKVAAMPAAAPATSKVFRSAELSGKHCARSEPIAPPVMMIGPSAPNGPPDPIAIAEDIGFRMATLS